MSTLTLDSLRTLPEELLRMPAPGEDAGIIDQLEALERGKSAICAAQARLADQLAVARMTPRGVSASAGAEVALARHESPHAGAGHLRLGRALVRDLPHTYAALWTGDIDEHRAQIIATETADLTREDRLAADAEIAADLGHLGDKKLTVAIRRIVMRLDEAAALKRREKALANRRVAGRMLGDGTGEIKATVAEVDYARIMATLRAHAATQRAAGDPRSHGQIMSDDLTARLTTDPTTHQPGTGNSGAGPGGGIAVNLVVTAETLLGDDPTPGHIPGIGPIPASVCRSIVFADPEVKLTLRRLFATPHDGTLITMEAAARLFPPLLRHFFRIRDDLCRTPWCNAPIQHADHPQPHRDGGVTSTHNGQGLCERCNYLKETTGWSQQTISDDLDQHTIEITTPTGHRHRTKAPPQPTPTTLRSRMEIYTSDLLLVA